MDKCGLYLGCNIPFNAPDIEQSFRMVLPALGVDVVDLPGAACCPVWGTAPSFDINTWLAMSSRNLSIAESNGVDVMTGCNSCFGILSEARHMLEHEPERKTLVNEKLSALGRAYSGEAKVFHVTHVLHETVGPEKITEKATHTLKQLKVAVQPGCHFLWPSKVMETAEKNPFRPIMLNNLVQALGAETPAYSSLDSCCGMGAMRSTSQDKSFSLFKDKFVRMKEEIDPDMVVTTCSSCYLQFDSAQKMLRDAGEIDFSIPVFYITQIIALCMGLDPGKVAAISQTPRDEIIAKIQSDKRRIQ